MLEKLDKLYLKDDTHSAYERYERFETFSRAPSMTVSDNIIEFERLYNKAKQHKMELPDGILAYRFLNSANISSHNKQLVRATLPELSYQSMKDQLKKIFSDPTNLVSNAKQEQAIKVEPAMEAMKRANTQTDFASNKIDILGRDVQVIFSTSGHYCIFNGRLNSSGMGSTEDVKEEVNLFCKELSEKTVSQKQRIAEKLH